MQTDKEYLFDILDAARLVLKYINNKTKEEFLQDVQCQDAVIRRIEIIGEAARQFQRTHNSLESRVRFQDGLAFTNRRTDSISSCVISRP